MNLLDRYEGCLFGLAIADAMGAPGKGLSFQEIKKRYGEEGITEFYEWGDFNPGTYTDATQLSFATAIGCIQSFLKYEKTGRFNFESLVWAKYREWHKIQTSLKKKRNPDSTCLSALLRGRMGRIDNRINIDRGSGGITRTVPVGLVFRPYYAFHRGVSCGAMTHGHPSGYLPAGLLSEIISRIIEGRTLRESIHLGLDEITQYDGHNGTLGKVKLALELAKNNNPIEESIQEIGEGSTGDEALAISVYCSVKFSESWARGVLAAINHSKNNDCTGAISGAILGTLLGIEAIPNKCIQNVEGSDDIRKLGADLFAIFQAKEELFSYDKLEEEEYKILSACVNYYCSALNWDEKWLLTITDHTVELLPGAEFWGNTK